MDDTDRIRTCMFKIKKKYMHGLEQSIRTTDDDNTTDVLYKRCTFFTSHHLHIHRLYTIVAKKCTSCLILSF